MRVSVQGSRHRPQTRTVQYKGLVLRTWSRVHCPELRVCVCAGCEPDRAWHGVSTPFGGWATSGRSCVSTQDFDQLLEVVRAALAKDPGTGFVFSCLSGQGRTTTAMVVAVLAFWHIRVREEAPRVRGGLPGAEHLVPRDAGSARRVWGQRWCLVCPAVLGRGPVGWADPWQGAPGMRERHSQGRSAPVPAPVLPQGFPDVVEEELVSVPDAKFTKGEFEVSML